MNEQLKTLIKKEYLKTYQDPKFLDLPFSLCLAHIFVEVYNEIPKYFNYYGNDIESIKDDTYHKEDYDSTESFKKLYEEFKDECIFVGGTIFIDGYIITDDNIMYSGGSLPERIKKCLVEEKQEHTFLFASISGQGGFTTRKFPIKNIENDILDNYNDDIPEKKFKEFIEMDKSGISILHGCPGGGKSYFIRYLISQYPDKSFIWFDQSLLTQATSDAFVQFILSHKDSILILEDCELLITSRDQQQNSILNTVLNISDGIIGDSLKIKFICTFNTDLTNVDKALLRKGRLKIKYEFKKLTKEKVEKLFNKFNIKDTPKEMALCDIYNYEEANGAETRSKRIGF